MEQRDVHVPLNRAEGRQLCHVGSKDRDRGAIELAAAARFELDHGRESVRDPPLTLFVEGNLREIERLGDPLHLRQVACCGAEERRGVAEAALFAESAARRVAAFRDKSPAMRVRGSAADPLWYKDAVIYQLHVRSFADSNGDGIGDFRGLLQQLDYIESLGVSGLWLLPFFASPLRDDGYDIADYRQVHPSYGTLEDFETFLQAAHDRKMQVIIELALNHTSDIHPWFQRARRSASGTRERDYYVWSDTDRKFEQVRIIFVDTERSNWTWDAEGQAYYWHRFFSHQPDLNYDNPAVLQEILAVIDFWLSRGVDGLRLDAIPYLVEREDTSCENLPETHAVIKRIRRHIDDHYANRLLLAEANQPPIDVRAYFADGDECHMAYHFPLMPRLFMAIHQEDRQPITDVLARTPSIPDNCQWALFLRNHDELTLEMVTDEERDYMYLAYTADPEARLNVGIRRRLAPLLANDRRRIELMTALLFSMPGTPIIYYGDEMGMGDSLDLGDRNGVRTPMQWTPTANAGFSTAPPERLVQPGHPRSRVRLPGCQRQRPARGRGVAAPLDAQHGEPAAALSRVRPRQHRVSRTREPEDRRASSPL